MDHQRRNLLRYGCSALLAGSCPWLSAREATPFDILDMDWFDPRRARQVPVRLYRPQMAHGAHGTPLVVFSHGIGGSRHGYSWLGRHFAAHGIASLHLQHVGSDVQLWHGNVFGMVKRLQEAARETEALARVRDLSFALDTLLAGELAASIDTSRIIAAGHSYGANTTLLASGAQVRRGGRTLDLRDARIRAAMVISAPPFYGEAEPHSILRTVTVPSLHITCTDDVIRIPGYFSAAGDRLGVFEAIGSARKWLTVYQGGSHSMFTDRGASGGASLNARVKAATQALALAFAGAVLDDDGGALLAWPRHHAAILAHFQAAEA